MKAIDEVIAVLDKKRVPYELIKHREVFMSKDLAKACKVKEEEIVKVLLLKTDKGKFVAGLLPANLMVKLKKLKAHIGTSELTIATEKELKSATGCPPGSLHALTNIYGIPAYIDPLLLLVRNAVFRGGSYVESFRVPGESLGEITGAEPISFSVKPSKYTAKSKKKSIKKAVKKVSQKPIKKSIKKVLKRQK